MTQEKKMLSKTYTDIEVEYLENVGHPVSPVRDKANKDKVYMNNQRKMCGLVTAMKNDGKQCLSCFLGSQYHKKKAEQCITGSFSMTEQMKNGVGQICNLIQP